MPTVNWILEWMLLSWLRKLFSSHEYVIHVVEATSRFEGRSAVCHLLIVFLEEVGNNR
jgi:hypothetical protein